MKQHVLLVLLVLLLTAPAAGKPLVIASKKFPENVLLAELLAQLSEARGIEVERRYNLGNTALVYDNLRQGNVDVYPEYTGTAQQFLDLTPASEPATVRRNVTSALLARESLTWGPPLGFNNTYVLAARADFAKKHSLETMSDLAKLSRKADALRMVTTHEFLARTDGFPALAKRYGIEGRPRGVEHGLAFELLRDNLADVTEVYSTEGLIHAYPLTLLRDDQGFFPPYEAAFLYSPRFAESAVAVGAVASLAGRLGDTTMRRLNHQVEVQGVPHAEVARQFLVAEQLVKDSAATAAPTTPHVSRKTLGFFGLLKADQALVWKRFWEHLWLTLVALLASSAVGIPLGYLATRRRWLSSLALGGSGLVQTVPGLAMLVFMIPLATALGRWLQTDAMRAAALIVLFLYGLLPIVRNTKQGVQGVDSAVLDAASGLGMTRWQRLRHVELPLALPYILAGVRTSAVIGTGAATLAAFIGAGGLGEAIISGLSVQNYDEVLTGAVPAAALALLLDGGFGLLQSMLTRRPGYGVQTAS